MTPDRIRNEIQNPSNEGVTNVEERLSEAERDFIINGLVDFNRTKASVSNHRDLIVVLRHEGNVVGGLMGYTHWNWLHIKTLWVKEAFRSRGLGTQLICEAEREACQRDCLHAHCDTFDFQALPFYQKLGYTLFGRLEDYPPGHTRYFLQKRNLNGMETKC